MIFYKIARAYIHTLAGFVRDHAYERIIENGDTEYITIATWANNEALNNARELVQAENAGARFFQTVCRIFRLALPAITP